MSRVEPSFAKQLADHKLSVKIVLMRTEARALNWLCILQHKACASLVHFIKPNHFIIFLGKKYMAENCMMCRRFGCRFGR